MFLPLLGVSERGSPPDQARLDEEAHEAGGICPPQNLCFDHCHGFPHEDASILVYASLAAHVPSGKPALTTQGAAEGPGADKGGRFVSGWIRKNEQLAAVCRWSNLRKQMKWRQDLQDNIHLATVSGRSIRKSRKSLQRRVETPDKCCALCLT